MSQENNSHPPMIISNRIGNRATIAGTLVLGFTSFIPLLKKTRMLAAIPNHPIIGGTTPEVTNTIENANVPMDQQAIANLNLEFFVLKILRAKSLNEFFSTPLETEYFFAMLRNPQ